MADKNIQSKSSVKSGNVNTEYASKVLGGIPKEKSVKEIAEVNTPGKAPGSQRK